MLAVLAAVGACESRDSAFREQPTATTVAAAGTTTGPAIALPSDNPCYPYGCPPPPPLTPTDETDWIVGRWLKSLPSYEFREAMCSVFDSTREPEPLDAWGTPTRTRCHPAETEYGIPWYVVISAGADRRFGTPDDLKIKGTSYTLERWGR